MLKAFTNVIIWENWCLFFVRFKNVIIIVMKPSVMLLIINIMPLWLVKVSILIRFVYWLAHLDSQFSAYFIIMGDLLLETTMHMRPSYISLILYIYLPFSSDCFFLWWSAPLMLFISNVSFPHCRHIYLFSVSFLSYSPFSFIYSSSIAKITHIEFH